MTDDFWAAVSGFGWLFARALFLTVAAYAVIVYLGNRCGSRLDEDEPDQK